MGELWSSYSHRLQLLQVVANNISFLTRKILLFRLIQLEDIYMKIKASFQNLQSSILSQRIFDTEKRSEFNETNIGCKLVFHASFWNRRHVYTSLLDTPSSVHFLERSVPRWAPTFPFHSSRKASYSPRERGISRSLHPCLPVHYHNAQPTKC